MELTNISFLIFSMVFAKEYPKDMTTSCKMLLMMALKSLQNILKGFPDTEAD